MNDASQACNPFDNDPNLNQLDDANKIIHSAVLVDSSEWSQTHHTAFGSMSRSPSYDGLHAYQGTNRNLLASTTTESNSISLHSSSSDGSSKRKREPTLLLSADYYQSSPKISPRSNHRKLQNQSETDDAVIPIIATKETEEDFSKICLEILHQFVATVNMGDACAIQDLLITHCSADSELTIKYKSTDTCPYSGCNFMEVCGSHAISVFFENCLVAIPDSRMVIQETKSKYLGSGLLTLSCRYAFKGTKTLKLACDRDNCLILTAMDKLLGDKIVVHCIEGENRKIITTGENTYPLDRMILGTMDKPFPLKLFGAAHITFDPSTSDIVKIMVTHSHRKR